MMSASCPTWLQEHRGSAKDFGRPQAAALGGAGPSARPRAREGLGGAGAAAARSSSFNELAAPAGAGRQPLHHVQRHAQRPGTATTGLRRDLSSLGGGGRQVGALAMARPRSGGLLPSRQLETWTSNADLGLGNVEDDYEGLPYAAFEDETSRPSTSGSVLTNGLASTTTKENMRYERLGSQIEERLLMSRSDGSASVPSLALSQKAIPPAPKTLPAVEQRAGPEGPGAGAGLAMTQAPSTGHESAAAARPAAAARAATFEEDVRSFEGRLEEMMRNIRMDNMQPERDLREEKRKEELLKKKKQEEKELRRKREQAWANINPQRRVDQRLELFQEAGLGKMEEMIPMHGIRSISGFGGEYIDVVDVAALQGRCLGLGAGGLSGEKVVRDLLDKKHQKVKWEATAAQYPDHIKANKKSGGDSIQSRTKSSMQAKMQRQCRSGEKRHKQAEINRVQIGNDKSQRLVSTMRSEWKLSSTPTPGASKAGTRSSVFPLHSSPRATCRGLGGSLSGQLLLGAGGAGAGRRKGPAFRLAARGVVYVLFLLFGVRSRNRKAEVAKNFCVHLIKHRSLKDAMHRTIVRVKKVQRFVRDFLKRKGDWCQRAGQMWEKYEDKMLQESFPPAELGKQQQRFGRGTKSIFIASHDVSAYALAAASEAGELDWRAFRIPMENRRFALGRFYFSQVRSHVQHQRAWSALVDVIRSSGRDVQHFLSICGLEQGQEVAAMGEAEKERLKLLNTRKQKLSDLLTFGEQEAQELITQQARLLRDAGFQGHPANREAAPASPRGGRVARRALPSMLLSVFSASSQAAPQAAGTAAAAGASKAAAPTAPTSPSSPAVRASRVDMEELFKRFGARGWQPGGRGSAAGPGGGGTGGAGPQQRPF